MLKNLIKDTAIYGIADFASKLITFALFPLYTHALTVEQFGIFALVTTLGYFLGVIFNCGLNNAVQRAYLDPETSPEQQESVVTTGLICLIFFGLLASFFFLTILANFGYSLLANLQISWEMMLVGSLGSFLMQLNVFCMDVLRLYFRPWKFAFLNLLQNGTMIALPLYFVFKWQMGVIGYLTGVALAYACTLPVSLGMIRSSLTYKFNIKIAKDLIQYGYPFIFAGIAFWIFASMDRWMLAELSDTYQVGLYSIAFKFASVLIFINTAFGQAWSPFALKAYRSYAQYKTEFSRFMILWLYLILLIAITWNFFSQELIIFLTPREYWSALNCLPFITLGLAFVGAGQIVGIGLSLEKKTIHFTYASWLTAGMNYLLNFLFIPLWGAEGAACATLASNLLLFAYYLISSQYYHPLPINYRHLAICLFIFVTALCYNIWLLQLPWSPLIMGYKCAFLAVILLLGLVTKIYRFKELYQTIQVS